VPGFGAAHLAWLACIAAIAISVSILCRRDLIPKSALRIALVALLAGGELQRLFKDGVAFPDRMPLHLCNITTWVAVIACITLSPLAGEITYCCGLVGAGMALITPDMGSEWPARFFINHGGLVITALVLAVGRITPIRPGAPWRALGFLGVYGSAVGVFNWRFGTNYAYLARKPSVPTVMDLLGPWPVYLLGLAVMGLILFWLECLPFRPKKAVTGVSLFVAKPFQRTLVQQPIEGQPSSPDGQHG
jgi:hypothetical integral membrane protein (TIGR02206 family)